MQIHVHVPPPEKNGPCLNERIFFVIRTHSRFHVSDAFQERTGIPTGFLRDSTQLSLQLRRYAPLNTGHFFREGGGYIAVDNINIIFHASILKRIRTSNSAIQKFIATTKPEAVYDRFMVYAILKGVRYLNNARASISVEYNSRKSCMLTEFNVIK